MKFVEFLKKWWKLFAGLIAGIVGTALLLRGKREKNNPDLGTDTINDSITISNIYDNGSRAESIRDSNQRIEDSINDSGESINRAREGLNTSLGSIRYSKDRISEAEEILRRIRERGPSNSDDTPETNN